MKMKKKIVIPAAIAVILIAGISLVNRGCYMNKFMPGFRFEKYMDSDEKIANQKINEALNQLHPVGSDVDAAIKTLEKAGATWFREGKKNYPQNTPENQRAIVARYRMSIFGLGGFSVTIEPDTNNKIKWIKAGKVFDCP